MLIRGNYSSNVWCYGSDNSTKYHTSDLRMINMETVQMIEGIRDSSSNTGYFLVAYVNTGRTNFGPVQFNVVHPASFDFTPSDLKNIVDIDLNNSFVDSSKDYRVVLNKKNDYFYRSRDTNNIYIIRKYMRQLTRNMTHFILSFANNFKNFSNKLLSWDWFIKKENNHSTFTNNAKNMMLRKVRHKDDSRVNDFVGVNGIEIVPLGYYSSKENISVELNKIQREYSKYIRGTLSCFEPPKVYQLGVNRLKVSDIKSGNPIVGSVSNDYATSFRYTTKPYVANGKVIADVGLYIDANTWLRSGIDYDISFPTYKGSGNKTYKLVYKFKGQYIGLGTKTVNFNYNG